MRKRILMIAIICIAAITLTGCSSSSPVLVNVDNGDQLYSNQLVDFTQIGDMLYYDTATRIVYRVDNTYGSSVLIPYFASNGLPYRYNPETNTLEQIEL